MTSEVEEKSNQIEYMENQARKEEEETLLGGALLIPIYK